jgi:polar amino acid transport system substrate-binding protein
MDAMDFSDIYYIDSQSFVTVQALADQFTTLDDTNKAELSIGVQNGSIQADLAEQYSPDADIVVLGKVTDIIAELLGGKLDGAYIATAIAKNYAVNYPDLTIVLDVPEDVEGSAVGVCKGNAALLAGVNMAIAAAQAEGAIDRFVAEANELATGNIYEGLIED